MHGDAAAALDLLRGIPAHLREACVGQVSEIMDGDPPFEARGCFAQAWGVAEILRAWSDHESKPSGKTQNGLADNRIDGSHEHERSASPSAPPRRPAWKKWGPYLSERQWGTVREDYSPHGNAWDYFPHDHARSRAYRWGEDGIAGFSDDQQTLCLSLALWNERDPILKERLFGLTNGEGNHGEDVKELYYYLDATPTHSYLKMLYKYPQAAFPYADLVAENRRRGIGAPEYELLDTGVFDDDRYFDVFVEYAQAQIDDVLMRITAHNRGGESAPLHILPQLVFRNTWSWKRQSPKPLIRARDGGVVAEHEQLGAYHCQALGENGAEGLWLFTENETNVRKLHAAAAAGPFKDAFHEFLIDGRREAIAANHAGTKAAAQFRFDVPARGSVSVQLRLSRSMPPVAPADFDRIVRPARRGGRRLLRRAAAGYRRCRCAAGAAPGACRHDLEQAVLLLRHCRVDQRRSRPRSRRRPKGATAAIGSGRT